MSTYKYDIDRHVNPAWQSTDELLEELFVKPDKALESALSSHKSEHLPAINVSPLQGTLLFQLAMMQSGNASRPIHILEVGTLAGYSTIWLAKAAKASGGSVLTLEFEEKHAKVAQENLQRAGLHDCTEIRVGDARQTLEEIVKSGRKYDMIFIDADKPAYCDYWKLSLQLSHPGTVIIADNVIREGGIANPENTDERVVGVRKFLHLASKTPNVVSTALQLVSGKGWDGFSMHYVT